MYYIYISTILNVCVCVCIDIDEDIDIPNDVGIMGIRSVSRV